MKKSQFKAKFRIKKIQRGYITLYQAQIKTLFGWRNFYTNNNGRTHFSYLPNIGRWNEENSINNYIRSKGWEKHQVLIIDQ